MKTKNQDLINQRLDQTSQLHKIILKQINANIYLFFIKPMVYESPLWATQA